MSLRVVIVGLTRVTASDLDLIAYQIANPPRPTVVVPPLIAGPPMTSYLVAGHRYPLPASVGSVIAAPQSSRPTATEGGLGAAAQ